MRRWDVFEFMEDVDNNYLFTSLFMYERTVPNPEGLVEAQSSSLLSVELDNGRWWIQVMFFLNIVIGDDDDFKGAY